MTNKLLLVGSTLVLALIAVVGYTIVTGSSDPESMGTLADQIRTQTEATRTAVALANDVWVLRSAGLGLGLAGGALVGGIGAYWKWGDGR